MYVCLCKGITDTQIQTAIENGADYTSLREDLGIAMECGQCGNTCKEMMKQHQQECAFYEVRVA